MVKGKDFRTKQEKLSAMQATLNKLDECRESLRVSNDRYKLANDRFEAWLRTR